MCICGSTAQVLTALGSLHEFVIKDERKVLYHTFLKKTLVPLLRHLDPAVRKQAAATIGTVICVRKHVAKVRTSYAIDTFIQASCCSRTTRTYVHNTTIRGSSKRCCRSSLPWLSLTRTRRCADQCFWSSTASTTTISAKCVPSNGRVSAA